MTVYYAAGGGLGHRTRAGRVLEALGIEEAEVLTSADLPQALERDREAHREWLAERFGTRRVIVDAFPAGLQGELSGIEGPSFEYVARLLKWDAYRRAVPHPSPRFETAYVVEALDPAHAEFVRQTSAEVLDLNLAAPRPRPPASPIAGPYSILVHSGPAEEVLELVAYARELGRETVFVATRCDVDLPPGFQLLETDRPFDHFDLARRIISAAGFNLMLETELWAHKHHVLPLPRRFDDQFLRAARRRARVAAGTDAAAWA